MRLLALALIALLACGNAFADSQAQPIVIKDVPKFLDYQRDLRGDMQEGSKFKHVDGSSKRRLFAAQDRLFALLEGTRTIAELDDAQKIDVYNAQAEIVAVLTDAELDRPICKHERPIGSNLMQTVCITKRDRLTMRERARSSIMRSRACAGPECRGN